MILVSEFRLQTVNAIQRERNDIWVTWTADLTVGKLLGKHQMKKHQRSVFTIFHWAGLLQILFLTKCFRTWFKDEKIKNTDVILTTGHSYLQEKKKKKRESPMTNSEICFQNLYRRIQLDRTDTYYGNGNVIYKYIYNIYIFIY